MPLTLQLPTSPNDVVELVRSLKKFQWSKKFIAAIIFLAVSLRIGVPNVRYVYQYGLMFLNLLLFDQIISPAATAKYTFYVPITNFWNHLNNAAYLRYAELARVNWFARTNIWNFLKNNFGYHLAYTAVTLRYRREINPFQTIEIHTRVVHWDMFNFYVEQKFIDAKSGFIHCVIYGQYTVTHKGKRVTPELLENTKNRGLLMLPWNLDSPLGKTHADTWSENKELYECDLPIPKSLEKWVEFLTQSSAESKLQLT
ncbi:hypothetical protein RFI_05971 [Reticulomyxa filosa]|uniref:Mesenchymal stem cell protein DSCD75 n=1 Tax=Reticulomyxa filosa TaxID=46433 RepID=X6NYT4_RETFI|nr:hypothetical protein RFI_05971 [Reticulomyxa filosa]|eukprot:ETO31146.1 hypothetical protein RFI_05971 [Reticulomyxa filosa]